MGTFSWLVRGGVAVSRAHVWAKWLQKLSRLGCLQCSAHGQSGYITPLVSGGHMWANGLHNANMPRKENQVCPPAPALALPVPEWRPQWSTGQRFLPMCLGTPHPMPKDGAEATFPWVCNTRLEVPSMTRG